MPGFLADAGVPVELVRIIRLLTDDPQLTLNWEIRSVHEFRRSNQPDVEQLRFARDSGRILVISGGPEEDVYRALAKLFYRREEWSELFETDVAVILLGDGGMITKYTAEEFRPDTASRSRQQLNQPPPVQRRATRRTRRDVPPDQLELTEEDTGGNPG